MAVTIRDVAREAGVSISAISRILNNDSSLSVTEETRQLVWDTVNRLGYRPARRRMHKPKTKSVAVLMAVQQESESKDPYWLIIRESMERQAEQLGLSGCQFFYSLPGFMQYLQEKNRTDFDGLAIVGHIGGDSIQRLFSRIPHIVFVSHRPQSVSFDSVWADLSLATKNVLDYLLSLGRKRIGFLGGVEHAIRLDQAGNIVSPAVEDMRLVGFLQYMHKAELYRPEDVHVVESWSSDGGYKAMREILTQDSMPDAFVVANDMMAMGAVSALIEAGLKVPDDMALISFNDLHAAAYMHPALTTVHIPAKRMGETAIRLLLEQFEGRDYPVSHVLPTRLMIRGSCGGSPENTEYTRYIV